MAPRPPIKLNGVVLPPHMIAAEAQHHPSQTPAAAFQAAARALIVRTLLLEEAKREAITAEPELIAPGKRELDDEARIRALMEARIPVTEPDEGQCRAFYDAAPSRFRSPDLYEASHILFLAHPHDAQAYAEAVARAEAIIAELSAVPGRFEAIAREQSECDSRANGGRLGQIVPGRDRAGIRESPSGIGGGTDCGGTGTVAVWRPCPQARCPRRWRNTSVRICARADRMLSGGATMAPRRVPPISSGLSARRKSRALTCPP